ncbi:DUF4254 domain-containing protein [Desulfocurvus vexinensis]|uniref:DUF4254 domain-containing protein n=1 Tax=Desulfocurvus vexinensis TaxID=399548 RepID=UPI0004B0F9A6|nr:DUF4254 domain-containing protein [Desulfocurvus vexinensis]
MTPTSPGSTPCAACAPGPGPAADFATLTACVRALIDAQGPLVADWHSFEPPDAGPGAEPAPAADLAVLRALAAGQHLANFRLWHVEDEARRTDVGPEVIAHCKRRIDGLNQRRNDLIERVDACLVALVTPFIPEGTPARHNTETVGMALDRLSIIALKIFHMDEQARREDADAAHREACARKLAVLHEQRDDLARAVLELLDDYARGLRRPKVYYQFKMYNDPALNPALYARRGA